MSKPITAARERWARLRFSIIGPLLAAPPEHGQLTAELERLAQKKYRHPTSQHIITFAPSTIERWLYMAQSHPDDPLLALTRKIPAQTGKRPSVSVTVEQALRAHYKQHPSWSYQLHYDNLVALAKKHPELLPLPSYPTLTRFMKDAGLFKLKKKRGKHRSDSTALEEEFVPREVRSFEVKHVHGLWHADYHHGSRRVLLSSGAWAPVYLLGFLDDRSRLCCHLQWYLAENTDTFCHGLSQAILKRGLPRALLTDNGKPMTAAETTEGLARLGIIAYTTLPYSPEQNAKQECFWAQVEGRLMPMLEGQKDLTLNLLNEATQAWVELEYHQHFHRELGDAPLSVALRESSVGRPAPDSERLRHTFRTEETRTLRRSDGTISVYGVRFELPVRYLSLQRPTIRVARWDLSSIDLVDPHTGTLLCALHPLDKNKNADRQRRIILNEEVQSDDDIKLKPGIAPHLAQLMEEYAATGLPPAYLPHSLKNNASENDLEVKVKVKVKVKEPS
jgi:transposase InsO family protein